MHRGRDPRAQQRWPSQAERCLLLGRGRAPSAGRSPREEEAGRLRLDETCVGHLQQSELRRGAETVFNAAADEPLARECDSECVAPTASTHRTDPMRVVARAARPSVCATPIAALALHQHDGVDQVLQHSGARQVARLGHAPHEQDGHLRGGGGGAHACAVGEENALGQTLARQSMPK